MPKPLTERGRLLEATSTSDTGAVRRPIQIITPGWGSSGYYSPEVLQEAANNRVIPAGTHMYFDHATESEHADRPERSVRDIAAVLTEDARWDGTRLAAEAHILGQYADMIGELAPHIGVSISGSATDIVIGEADGRTGPIIQGLAHVASVDFVTHAGRGGKVLEVMESARPIVEARNIGQWVESRIHRDFTVMADDMAGDGRLTREERIGLSSAIGDALAAFVTSLETHQPQLYTRDIWADPQDTVAAAVEALKNVPVNPAGQSTTTEESQEDTMPQIEEARLRELEEAHGRVPTLESERDTAVRERDTALADRDTAVAERDSERRRNRATDIVRDHRHAFTALEARGLVVDLPLTEAGELDEDAFRGQLDEHAAAVEAGRGAGSVSGFGSTTQPSSTTQVNQSKPTATPWGRPLTEKEA